MDDPRLEDISSDELDLEKYTSGKESDDDRNSDTEPPNKIMRRYHDSDKYEDITSVSDSRSRTVSVFEENDEKQRESDESCEDDDDAEEIESSDGNSDVDRTVKDIPGRNVDVDHRMDVHYESSVFSDDMNEEKDDEFVKKLINRMSRLISNNKTKKPKFIKELSVKEVIERLRANVSTDDSEYDSENSTNTFNDKDDTDDDYIGNSDLSDEELSEDNGVTGENIEMERKEDGSSNKYSSTDEEDDIESFIKNKLNKMDEGLPVESIKEIEIQESSDDEASTSTELPKNKQAFWKHIKWLYDEYINNKISPETYKKELIEAFSVREKIRRKVDETYSRRMVQRCKEDTKPVFPTEKYLNSFFNYYNSIRNVRHEIVNPKLMPVIDRLNLKSRGKLKDFYVVRGDILKVTSIRTHVPTYSMISNIFVDENAKYYVSLRWLKIKNDYQEDADMDLNIFEPEKYEIGLEEEKLHSLENFIFVCHKPKLEEYDFEATIATTVQKTYRNGLKKEINRIDYQRKRDVEVRKVEEELVRMPKKPSSFWIEATERYEVNNFGSYVLKEVLQVGSPNTNKEPFL